MEIKCKNPDRWFLRCAHCQRPAAFFTSYPGKDWENRDKRTSKLYILPGFQTISYFEVCPQCNEPPCDNFPATLDRAKFSVSDLLLCMDSLLKLIEHGTAFLRALNRIRYFIEFLKLKPGGFEDFYEGVSAFVYGINKKDNELRRQEIDHDFKM